MKGMFVRQKMMALWLIASLFIFQFFGTKAATQLLYTVIFMAVFLVALFWGTLGADAPKESLPSGKSYFRFGLLFALFLLWKLLSGVKVQRLPIIEPESLLSTGILWLAFAFLLLSAVFSPSQWLASRIGGKGIKKAWLWLGFLMLLALSIRAMGLSLWEPNPQTRDMLALILDSHERFLQGENPYGLYQMQVNSVIPLTYLPFMWLGYMFPLLFKMDIRWMGILADCIVVLSLFGASQRGHKAEDGTERGLSVKEASALVLSAIWLFLPTVHWNGIYAEPHLWWGVLALLLLAFLKRRWWALTILLALAISTRHFGFILAPFILLYMWRELKTQRFLVHFTVFALLGLLFWLPFVIGKPDAFWFGTFRWLREFGPVHRSWFNHIFGLSAVFYRQGWDKWLPLVQAGSVLVVFLLYVKALWFSKKPLGEKRALAYTGAAYLLFVSLNGLIWYSFFLGALLILAMAVVGVGAKGKGKAESQKDLPRPLRQGILAIGLPLALLGGLFLAFSLVKSLRRSGLETAQALLSEQVKKGDQLVDESDWRVAFVKGKDFYARDEKPQGLRTMTTAFHLLKPQLRPYFTGNFQADKNLFFVHRQGVEAQSDRDSLGALGELFWKDKSGPFELLGLRPYRVDFQLSENLEDASFGYQALGEEEVPMLKKRLEKPASKDNPYGVASLPSWFQAYPKTCEFGRERLKMLYVHPKEEGEVRLHYPSFPLGKSLALTAGIETRYVRWAREEVRVHLELDGERMKTWHIPNLPGPRTWAMDTSRFQGAKKDLSLVIETDKDAQRWTCLELSVLNERPE